MLLNFDSLGEKTLNKIAQMALATQIEKAEKLTVNVKTDANLLAQGILESLAIDCQGIMVKESLRMDEMKIILTMIAVSPFKALRGKIKLTKPSQGVASVVLTETDIARAFNYENLQQQLENSNLIINGQSVTPEIKQIDCQLLETKKVIITAQVWLKEIKELQEVKIQIIPKVCQLGNGVLLEEVDLIQGQEFSPILINVLLEETQKLFNLKNFTMDGFSINIEQLKFSQGKLQVEAAAGMTHFPSF